MMPRKRKVLHTDKNRKKGKREQFQEVWESTGEASKYVDRISELPEHLIHHILTQLRCSKDVARTCVLSKKWKSICASFQDLTFDQRNFPVHRLQNTSRVSQVLRADEMDFINFVNTFMATRLEHFSCLKSLRLHVISFNQELAQAMNCWIDAAMQKQIKELDIYVKVVKGRRYNVPKRVLISKTISSLKLYGCRLDGLATLELYNLRQLSIKKTPIDEVVIQNFIQRCPLIEDFRLVECVGLERLHFPVLLNLKRVEVHKCHRLCSIDIKGKNLHTFCYHEKDSIQCHIKLACYENLRNLTIKASKMKDMWFQEQISKFLVLENLTLLECHSLKRITVMSSKLKKLSIIRCRKLEDVNIEAPNLFSFEYSGKKACFSNLNSTRLQDVKVNFESQLPLSEIKDFLGSISRLEGFKLVIYNSKQNDVTICEEVRTTILLLCSACKLELTKSPLVLQEIINRRLQECRPKRLCVLYPSPNKSIQLIKEMLPYPGEVPFCCQYYSNKCWRHYLKSFTVVDSPDKTIFRLDWRPRPVKSRLPFPLCQIKPTPTILPLIR